MAAAASPTWGSTRGRPSRDGRRRGARTWIPPPRAGNTDLACPSATCGRRAQAPTKHRPINVRHLVRGRRGLHLGRRLSAERGGVELRGVRGRRTAGVLLVGSSVVDNDRLRTRGLLPREHAGLLDDRPQRGRLRVARGRRARRTDRRTWQGTSGSGPWTRTTSRTRRRRPTAATSAPLTSPRDDVAWSYGVVAFTLLTWSYRTTHTPATRDRSVGVALRAAVRRAPGVKATDAGASVAGQVQDRAALHRREVLASTSSRLAAGARRRVARAGPALAGEVVRARVSARAASCCRPSASATHAPLQFV